MMKHILLIAVSLLSAPIFANSKFDCAKTDLEGAQSALDASEKRVNELRAKADAVEQQIAAITGKAELAKEMEAKMEEKRRLLDQCNSSVKTCEAKIADLQKAITRAGQEGEVVKANGKYTLRKSEPQVVSTSAPVEASRKS